MIRNFLLLFLAVAVTSACSNAPKKVIEEKKVSKYEASWESLAQHNEAPDWFQDAKLGIYFHWGVYSVPAFGSEWYPSRMHYEGNKEYAHHLEKYGHPSEFGYHNFVPMFKAENFDADQWADLFEKAGARFAGPVAEHHDGFSMWDSEITPWNAVDEGPHKDITGLLQKSITDRGMKFITTFHHARNLQEVDTIVKDGEEIVRQLGHYPRFENMPTVSEDEKLKYLYGNIPSEQWYKEVWFGKLKEVIDKYQPDIIWFDSWLDRVPENLRQEFCAYYLNEADRLGKEVVIVRKQEDLPLDVSVDDLEKSRKNVLEKKSWMTDETVSTGSWCYTDNLKIKPAADVLHVLIDIVSKNGVLLLNISPMADGTIPADQQDVLLKMGAWLEKYGEAIYGSRPWYTFGEGPTKEPEGHFKNHQAFLKVKYSAKDIRYTTNNGNIYVTILGWPGENQEVLFEAFSKSDWTEIKAIKNVTLLGCDEKIDYELTDKGLTIITPVKAVDSMAVVFKVEV
ncbi:alpha-L-fucosidase [Prolixibacteraceae bacterium Z1-6]|uniref:alpha-L-fucosidase n=1 Tax=Draconibacterium aestuarii TaxID=2998507 RepID=A0A9X3F271_9BACT|nr:alpha-L-fucosidase [Prolixibacteraceae bacterium Z1-6]